MEAGVPVLVVPVEPVDSVESAVSELQRLLQDPDLSPEKKTRKIISGLETALGLAAVQTDSCALSRLKSSLIGSGLLLWCVQALRLDPGRLPGGCSTAARLAHITSSCCVGAEPGRHSEEFDRLLLPSVMEGLLLLASRLMRRGRECVSLFRKVMESVGWLLRAHTQLTAHVLNSLHYEQIQMCDDVTVSLQCVLLWINICTASRDFLSGLSEDSVMLLLNDAVGQLAVSPDHAVGGAAVRLVLLIGSQLKPRLRPLLLQFKGLDSLLDKDWRGRGFDQDIDQLIKLLQSATHTASHTHFQNSTEHVRAACVIQAAWRSYRTRRRVKSLHRAVCLLQRRYRAQRRRRQQQQEAERLQEELSYQVCVRRQRARREFHQKQRQLLQLLPPGQVQAYLQECERRAAVLIQSAWRGFRERRHRNTHTHTPQHTHTQQQAARTLQRAVRHFLKRRRALKAPPTPSLWIGQKGLTDRRRAELKRQVDEYITLHPSSSSPAVCVCLHEECERLLVSLLQSGEQQRREETHRRALLVHTHTLLEQLTDAPSLSVVTATDAEMFLSPSAPVAARARQSHNATLQAGRLPWWRTLGDSDRDDITSCPGSAHTDQLEAELGGLFLGGGVS